MRIAGFVEPEKRGLVNLDKDNYLFIRTKVAKTLGLLVCGDTFGWKKSWNLLKSVVYQRFMGQTVKDTLLKLVEYPSTAIYSLPVLAARINRFKVSPLVNWTGLINVRYAFTSFRLHIFSISIQSSRLTSITVPDMFVRVCDDRMRLWCTNCLLYTSDAADE